jgi:catechol 2,3-dioxygenase-like lactoylglutathione lyase family enzyme
VLLAAAWLATLSATATEPVGLSATAVEAIGMTVSDLDASVAFFRDVLTFELKDTREASGRDTELLTGVFGARTRTARLRLGEETIELTEFLAPRGRPMPADTRGNDQWFQHVALIVSDMDAAYASLREHRVAHGSTGPQRLPDWNPNAGGIRAFYFRDPDGHFLEILQFPPGKGDPRWQQRDRLFLGIDHTALVSTDTDRSLRFYRDGLGLRVAGGAENHGIEQEHLNNVFGVPPPVPGWSCSNTWRHAPAARRRTI